MAWDARASNLRDLTTYSPVRMLFSGLYRTIFGVIWALPAYFFIAAGPVQSEPRAPGDMPQWWMFLLGFGFAVLTVWLVGGGIGRIVAAFRSDCYLRAGADGIAVRMPRQRWFGWFRIVEYALEWSEIKQIVHWTYRVNFIPLTTELHIYLNDGSKIEIARKYFSKSPKRLQEELLAIRTGVVR